MPWSLSQYGLYQKCPSAFNFRINLRIEDPKGPSASRGIETHGQLESYLKTGEWSGNIRPFTRQKAEQFRELGFQPEVRLAFDENWQLVDWKDPKAWVRCVIDAMRCVDGIISSAEWKTGKEYEDHAAQRNLYLCLMMSAHSSARIAEIETIYSDLDYAVRDTLPREEVEARQKQWKEKVTPMLNDTFFSPRPGQHCRWCNYSKFKGGPCTVA